MSPSVLSLLPEIGINLEKTIKHQTKSSSYLISQAFYWINFASQIKTNEIGSLITQ